jgi:hypothetical protein
MDINKTGAIAFINSPISRCSSSLRERRMRELRQYASVGDIIMRNGIRETVVNVGATKLTLRDPKGYRGSVSFIRLEKGTRTGSLIWCPDTLGEEVSDLQAELFC